MNSLNTFAAAVAGVITIGIGGSFAKSGVLTARDDKRFTEGAIQLGVGAACIAIGASVLLNVVSQK